ncbi:MAG: hypothetical protein WCO84_04060 [bacterium]
MKKDILLKKRKWFDVDSEKIEFNPKQQWDMLVFTFLFLAIAFLFVYGFLFFHDNSDIVSASSLENNSQISIENLSKSKISATLSPWQDKEKKFNEYLLNRPAFDFLR